MERYWIRRLRRFLEEMCEGRDRGIYGTLMSMVQPRAKSDTPGNTLHNGGCGRQRMSNSMMVSLNSNFRSRLGPSDQAHFNARNVTHILIRDWGNLSEEAQV